MNRLRKQWWLVPALLLLWGAMRWAGTVGSAVRVRDLPSYPLVVQHGRLVFVQNDPGRSPALVVQAARGGQVRTLEVPSGHLPRGAEVTETHLVYFTSSEGGTPRPSRRGPNGGRLPIQYALYRCSLKGAPSEVKRFTGAPGAILTREGCYWWGEGEEARRPLWFLPLLAGEPREIGGGSGMLLHSRTNGGALVLLPTRRPGEVRHSVQVRGNAPPLAVVEDLPGIQETTQLAGRRYWVERNERARAGEEPHPHRIMSSRQDGSDRKIVLEAQNRAVEFGQLSGHGEDLYVALAEPLSGRTDDGKSIRVVSLCRIRAEDPQAALQRLCTIPGQTSTFYLDGTDAYFAVPENREKWWDWSAGGLIPHRVIAWYHFRLPLQ